MNFPFEKKEKIRKMSREGMYRDYYERCSRIRECSDSVSFWLGQRCLGVEIFKKEGLSVRARTFDYTPGDHFGVIDQFKNRPVFESYCLRSSVLDRLKDEFRNLDTHGRFPEGTFDFIEHYKYAILGLDFKEFNFDIAMRPKNEHPPGNFKVTLPFRLTPDLPVDELHYANDSESVAIIKSGCDYYFVDLADIHLDRDQETLVLRLEKIVLPKGLLIMDISGITLVTNRGLYQIKKRNWCEKIKSYDDLDFFDQEPRFETFPLPGGNNVKKIVGKFRLMDDGSVYEGTRDPIIEVSNDSQIIASDIFYLSNYNFVYANPEGEMFVCVCLHTGKYRSFRVPELDGATNHPIKHLNIKSACSIRRSSRMTIHHQDLDS